MKAKLSFVYRSLYTNDSKWLNKLQLAPWRISSVMKPSTVSIVYGTFQPTLTILVTE